MNVRKKLNYKETGITLVALVVTIIVLLILAGITLSFALSNNGILGRVEYASIQHNHSTVYENIQMLIQEYTIDKESGKPTSSSFINYLKANNIVDGNGVVNIQILLGRSLTTGNGSGEEDIYKVEEANGTEGEGYYLVYYGKYEEITIVGKVDEKTTVLTSQPTREDFFTWIENEDGTVTITGVVENTSKDPNGIGWYYTRETNTVISETEIVFPSTINGKRVKIIGDGMGLFKVSYAENSTTNDMPVTSIIIPSSVTSIGNCAFMGCKSLTSIEIPSSVTSIGYSAFLDCESLTSIEIPSNITSIEQYTFAGCRSLTSIEIPSGVTSIEERLFSGCSSLTSIEIPSGVTSIGSCAFYDCNSLTSIEIPSGVTSIGSYAFSYCNSLTSIEIPSGVTSIEEGLFSGCSSLTSIEIPDGVTQLPYGTFWGCTNLQNIRLPNQLTYIGEACFNSCSALTSITIPSTIQNIESNYSYYWDAPFDGCDNLATITIKKAENSISGAKWGAPDTTTVIWDP